MIAVNALTVAPSVVRAALGPLAEQLPDPNDVKPGWLGFVVVIALMVAVVLLLLSFRKQLRKADNHFGPTDGDGAAGPREGSDPNGATKG